MIEHFSIVCPKCEVKIDVPFIKDLEARALEEADLCESTVREQLAFLKNWLRSVSLFWIVVWWFRRGKDRT